MFCNFNQRGTGKTTKKLYSLHIKNYEEFTEYDIVKLLNIAEKEENDNIRWKNTDTRRFLLNYREHLYSKHSVGTAKTYFSSILTFYRHFEIEIPQLPYFSTKNTFHYQQISYDKLPDREVLQQALNIAPQKMKPVILFLSSSGVSRIDAYNITIKDYLSATKEYHNSDDIYEAISQMNNIDVIPTFFLTRQKTKQDYFTFCSHEAVKSINLYLLSREDKLTNESKLFNISYRYIGKAFESINHKLNLGTVGAFNRIRAHMLRKYHASQLAEAGFSTEKINLLQGRKLQGVAHEAYIRIKPHVLKEEYIAALPFLVIEEVNKFKTELEQTKEELKQVKNENLEIKKNIRDETERIVNELLKEYLD